MDISVLNRYKQDGFLRCSKHPDLDLYIWNYTDLATIRNKWDDITMLCRGLVTNSHGVIIARAFSKFFNYNEKNAYNPMHGEEYDILEKIDGSMILLFKYADTWHTCTRGSFKSEQCITAASMLSPSQLSRLNEKNTYVFEIVYPKNRVVVNYGQRSELVYLATFCTDGTELDDSYLMKDINIPIVGIRETCVFKSKNDIEQLRNHNTINEEGYVLHFKKSHCRLKVKFFTYVELHKVVCGLNEKTIKEWFVKGHSLESKLEGLPDEVHDFVKEVWASLTTSFDHTLSIAKTEFQHYHDDNRKEFIKHVKGHPMESIFIKLYDSKCYHQAVCKYIMS